MIFKEESRFQLYWADGRQHYGVVGERVADVNVVNRVPQVAVGLLYGQVYGQRTQLHFIDGNMNMRYCDKILRTIVMLFISHHHLMLMHGPMSHNSWNLKMSQFFHGLHKSPDMSPNEHVWDALD